MIYRILFIFFFFSSLLGAESKIRPSIEAGIFFPEISGTIKNIHGESNFKEDYLYDKTTASYFSFDLFLEYDYVPNLKVDYFNIQENSDVTLTKEVVVADGTFNSDVSTRIDFDILNAILYQDYKQKGFVFSLYGKKFYSGDFEFDTGLNTKILMWNFEVIDKVNLNKTSSWIHVNKFIPLPYLAFKYYLYDFRFYSDVSALSLVRAKAFNYQLGISYMMIKGLSLNANYLYENFSVVEKEDTVDFKTAGYKFSFMYAF